jgi:ABC-type arginine transport system permease subunit
MKTNVVVVLANGIAASVAIALGNISVGVGIGVAIAVIHTATRRCVSSDQYK